MGFAAHSTPTWGKVPAVDPPYLERILVKPVLALGMIWGELEKICLALGSRAGAVNSGGKQGVRTGNCRSEAATTDWQQDHTQVTAMSLSLDIFHL